MKKNKKEQISNYVKNSKYTIRKTPKKPLIYMAFPMVHLLAFLKGKCTILRGENFKNSNCRITKY